MSQIELFPFGENGITYTIFKELVFYGKLPQFLFNVTWIQKNKFIKLPDENESLSVYLFPSFGKRYGLGEPDVIIITKHHNIFFELETCNIAKLSKSKHFKKQMTNFIKIGRDIELSDMKKMTKKYGYEFSDGHRVKGTYKQRKLFMDLLKEHDNKKRIPLFVVISEFSASEEKDLTSLILSNWYKEKDHFGYIRYDSIKQIKGLKPQNVKTRSEVSKVITNNLKE
jgi:hypothetical protein